MSDQDLSYHHWCSNAEGCIFGPVGRCVCECYQNNSNTTAQTITKFDIGMSMVKILSLKFGTSSTKTDKNDRRSHAFLVVHRVAAHWMPHLKEWSTQEVPANKAFEFQFVKFNIVKGRRKLHKGFRSLGKFTNN